MSNLGPNFYPKLVQMSAEVGMKPEDLIAVMISESGMSPDSLEKTFHGSGLVGFMPSTLEGLGFKGTWRDFIKLTGEQQLDYVKKLVQNFTKSTGGKPITSAAQYYCANFWPVSLQLPGIQDGNPDTAFIEAKPAVVIDRKTGEKWSKKYYDVGNHISADQESNAYKYNPIFDTDKKGAITYGDMMKRIDKIKQGSAYKQAIMEMQKSTDYKPSKNAPIAPSAKKEDSEDSVVDLFEKWLGYKKTKTPSTAPAHASTATTETESPGIMQTITNWLRQIIATEKQNKKLYKQYLPLNYMIIKIDASDYNNSIEFARILCAALDEELLSKSYTHTNGNDVEVECAIHGPSEDCLATIKQLSESVANSFSLATKKIGGIIVKTDYFMNKKSSYSQIDFKLANAQYRKFLLKFV